MMGWAVSEDRARDGSSTCRHIQSVGVELNGASSRGKTLSGRERKVPHRRLYIYTNATAMAFQHSDML